MNLKLLKSSIVLLIIQLSIQLAFSQPIVKFNQLPDDQLSNIRRLSPLNDGGIVFVTNTAGSKKFFLHKTDADANIVKSIEISIALLDTTTLNNLNVDVVQNVNGEIWLTHTSGNINQNPQLIINRFNNNFDFIGQFSHPTGNGYRKVGEPFPTSDSSIIFFTINNSIRTFKLTKIAPSGNIIWSKEKFLGFNAAAIRRVNPQGISKDGGLTYESIFPNFILLTLSDPNKYFFQSWEYSQDGTELSSFNRVLDYLSFDIDFDPAIVGVRKKNPDYQFYFSFFSNEAPFLSIFSEKLSASGTLLSQKSFEDELLYLPNEIKHKLDGENSIIAIGNKHIFFRGEDGKDLMEVIPLDNPYFSSVQYKLNVPNPSGGLWIYGVITEDNGNQQDVILKLRKNDFFVEGNAFEDINTNCIKDSSEFSYGERWACFKSDFRYFAWVDSNGFYKTFLPSDTFDVSVTEKGKLWKLCDQQGKLNLIQDTVHDLPLQPLAECPDLFVDVNIPYLVRCDTNTIHVTYKNPGTVTAIDPFIRLELDTFLTAVSSTLPLIPIGNNVYNIALPNINPNEEGEIEILAVLDCESTIIGQTHCVKAHIFPDSVCTSIPSCWDGENYVIEAICVNDTVYFRIKNEGLRPPSRPRPGTVLEDDIMKIAPIDIFLQPGQDTLIAYAANGKTIRLELPNDGCFPFPNFPSITIEGCGGIADTGFVITLPQNDEAAFLSEWCVENTDTRPLIYLSGNPKGYGNERFITDSTQLEYTIFFKIADSLLGKKFYIIDSLSPHLDITSFELGNSALPFTYVLYNNGIVRLDFEPVMKESENSIKIKAAPRKGTIPGTKLFNAASMYFDNKLIMNTNKIFHTVGEAFLIIDISTAIEAVKDKIAVNVFPNPFATQFRFVWNNQQAFTGDEWLNVYDLQVKLIYSERIDASGLNVETAQWQKGMYFWQLTKASNVLATGKIVRQ